MPSANVHEFTADLVVRRRSTPAEGVAVLDLVHPENEELPRWEPGAHIDLILDDGGRIRFNYRFDEGCP